MTHYIPPIGDIHISSFLCKDELNKVGLTLKNTDLNCTDPLICRIFFSKYVQYYKCILSSLRFSQYNVFFCSLFIARMQHMIHITCKSTINRVIMLLVKLPVHSWVLGESKVVCNCTGSWCTWTHHPSPSFKGQLRHHGFPFPANRELWDVASLPAHAL